MEFENIVQLLTFSEWLQLNSVVRQMNKKANQFEALGSYQ